jgi:aspartate/methionine/tyrosine aminotransferase
MNLRPFALERYFARHEFSARRLLGSSDPESMSVAELLALEPGSEEGWVRLRLGYTESRGDPGLREEIAGLFETISPGQVLVFSGAEEPIFAFMNAVFEPGDHVIVHFPSYQSHYAVAESLGLRVSRWRGDPASGWAPDPSALERLIEPGTRAILTCSPHNPTGYLFDRTAWDAIIAVVRRHGLILFSDEVYRGTEHDPADRLPAACDLYEKGVSLNGMSKSYGLAGLRLGWIATRDRALLDRMAAFKDYLTICNSAPSEYLGRIAVRHSEALFERTRRRLVSNRDLLAAFFERRKPLFRWTKPRAGTTVFPEFLGGPALAFCDRLVEETGIMLVPGVLFDVSDGEFIRFGYGRADCAEALAGLDAYLQNASGCSPEKR